MPPASTRPNFTCDVDTKIEEKHRHLIVESDATRTQQQPGKDMEPQQVLLPRSSHASKRKLLVAGGGGAALEAGGTKLRTDHIGNMYSMQDIVLHQAAKENAALMQTAMGSFAATHKM